jgi:hypothetical protein
VNTLGKHVDPKKVPRTGKAKNADMSSLITGLVSKDRIAQVKMICPKVFYHF